MVIVFSLDFVFTKSYINAIPRNKARYILTLTEKDTFDFVFLGSSRVENFINSKLIEETLEKRTINLGSQGAKLDDIYLFLLLLEEQKVNIKNLFIQVDYIYNFESNSANIKSQLLPYLDHSEAFDNYLHRKDSNYWYYKNIPFYKYATNDYSLGFREVFNNYIGKKTNLDYRYGFVPVYGHDPSSSFSFPKHILSSNKSFQEIEELCKKTNIRVYYFCSPICPNVQNKEYLENLKGKILNFLDYSKVIKDSRKFKNCSHLNQEGANEFTTFLIEDFLKKI